MDPADDFEDDSDIIFDSPPPSITKPKETPVSKESRYSTEEAREAREAALKQELESIRKINQVVEGVVESLEKAKGNMETVSQTVNSASTLLHTWTRILSQTEHNQRLILNPQWQGATQDMADIENEEHRRRQDAQRRQYEEQQRRETAARRAEEEERRKAATPARSTRGGRVSRLTGKPAPGTPSTSSSGYGQSSRGASRAGSSSGRSSSTVGRTRGTRGRGTT